jgi:hypothetical protein
VRAVHAIWKDGRIVPTQPVDWPDGTALTVEPLEQPLPADSEGDVWGTDPVAIARWMAQFDALPALRMSETEEAHWQDARRQMRDYTLARMQERSVEDRP